MVADFNHKAFFSCHIRSRDKCGLRKWMGNVVLGTDDLAMDWFVAWSGQIHRKQRWCSRNCCGNCNEDEWNWKVEGEVNSRWLGSPTSAWHRNTRSVIMLYSALNQWLEELSFLQNQVQCTSLLVFYVSQLLWFKIAGTQEGFWFLAGFWLWDDLSISDRLSDCW